MDVRRDQEREWSRNWARSATSNSGIQVVEAYQRRRQTLFEIVIISSLIGILGNVVAEAVVSSPLRVEVLTFATVTMIVTIIVFLKVSRKYGPHQPARITAHLEYRVLLDSYDKHDRNLIEYLMEGVGLREFEPFAKQVLTQFTRYIQAAVFRSRISNPRSEVSSIDGRTSEVTLTAELDEVAERFKLKGTRATLRLILYEGSIGFNPVRTHRVNLLVIFTMENPEHPLADEFVLQVIEPAMPRLAEYFSYAFKAELPIHKIQMLRDIVQRRHQQCLNEGMIDDWYLMNYYPYDGRSKTMLVVDKSLVNRDSPYGGAFEEPILAVLRETDLWGSYVTDSDEWSSQRGLTHLLEEMIYVEPARIVTIGRGSKIYVDKHLRYSRKKPEVVNLLENFTEIDDRDRFYEELRKRIDGMRGLSRKTNRENI